eukprot:6178820-Karenia_brevis.AAC.1
MEMRAFEVDEGMHDKLVAYCNLKPDAPGVKMAKPSKGKSTTYFEWWKSACHSRRLPTWSNTLEGKGIPKEESADISTVPELGLFVLKKFIVEEHL